METWGDSGQPLLRYEPWWHPRIPAARLGGTPHPRYDPWWPHDGPWRALMAARIPFTARIGVGAVQNRRPDHRVISTVCGDAGRPAHQRTETPRCARHRHDRFAPVCGTATIVSHPSAAPPGVDSHPARPPTPRNTALRAAPIRVNSHPAESTKTTDSHPSAALSRVDSHPDDPTKTAAPHPDDPTPSRLNAAFSHELGINSRLSSARTVTTARGSRAAGEGAWWAHRRAACGRPRPCASCGR
jgi:hypothetical protein